MKFIQKPRATMERKALVRLEFLYVSIYGSQEIYEEIPLEYLLYHINPEMSCFK